MVNLESCRKYLDPESVATLRDYHLLAQLIVDGFFLGMHSGPKPGYSLEYDKHRDYYPGDPLKLIDWKLFGKSDKYSIKQYEEETDLDAWLVVDSSSSMSYQGKRGKVSKFKYASYLAAAFAYLLLKQKDHVGLILFDHQLQKVLFPSAAYRQLGLILKELSQCREGQHSSFDKAASQAASRIKKRGLIVLFSDFLSTPEVIEKTLKKFLHRGSEILVFHVLTHEELHFPFKHLSVFQDMETGNRILLQPAFLQAEYIVRMKQYLEEVKKICHRYRISYQLLETWNSFDVALREFLAKRARMH
jgi:uncharacterized protein (DUF58 family)